jgi:hypothetical protein
VLDRIIANMFETFLALAFLETLEPGLVGATVKGQKERGAE